MAGASEAAGKSYKPVLDVLGESSLSGYYRLRLGPAVWSLSWTDPSLDRRGWRGGALTPCCRAELALGRDLRTGHRTLYCSCGRIFLTDRPSKLEGFTKDSPPPWVTAASLPALFTWWLVYLGMDPLAAEVARSEMAAYRPPRYEVAGLPQLS